MNDNAPMAISNKALTFPEIIELLCVVRRAKASEGKLLAEMWDVIEPPTRDQMQATQALLAGIEAKLHGMAIKGARNDDSGRG